MISNFDAVRVPSPRIQLAVAGGTWRKGRAKDREVEIAVGRIDSGGITHQRTRMIAQVAEGEVKHIRWRRSVNVWPQAFPLTGTSGTKVPMCG
jgi:hypothetical protein